LKEKEYRNFKNKSKRDFLSLTHFQTALSDEGVKDEN
jgi:hypothetical protein